MYFKVKLSAGRDDLHVRKVQENIQNKQVWKYDDG
jgi:hypothetical protein